MHVSNSCFRKGIRELLSLRRNIFLLLFFKFVSVLFYFLKDWLFL